MIGFAVQRPHPPETLRMTETPTADALVHQWWPLAVGLARRAGRRYPWLSDCFESEAAERLWHLARQFGGDGDERFAGLVRLAVRWGVCRVLDVERKRNPLAFLPQAELRDDEGRSADPLDFVGFDDADLAAADVRDEVARLLGQLPPLSRERVERYFLRGETFEDVGAAVGVSHGAARVSVLTALSQLRSRGQSSTRRKGFASDAC